ncbi:zinc finger protein OZF-like [Sitophilus oryzae]|uniref:Zinc finger protein OZF-like n=1 Tax=Sitophilus oryzae TaxID=7048 RepID=A0A6J2YBS5_SITOR|nr:zinc finger protein OZF-like [Sitophilus oryzae]
MNVNLSSFSYWALDPHFMDTEQEFEDKTKLFYQSAMCLMNPKQDPPIFSKPVTAFPPEPNPCECREPENYSVPHHDERILKFTQTNETIEVELESQKPPLPSQVLIKDPEKYKSEDRPYKCSRPMCNKTFLLKHHLTTHEKTHTGERPHVCVHCGKSFTHKYCLNTHLLLHSNERPYQCPECKKRFTLKHHLMSHTNVHRRERPFHCGECGKSFPLKKQLITHEKYHKGERPYVCKDCGDTFAQENHLVMHLRFHGSLTSFVCRDCGATFTRKFELDNHEKLHGKQPLICPTCNKEFLQKRTLLAHIKSHESKTTCRHCGTTFPDERTLEAHLATVHMYRDKHPPLPPKSMSPPPKTKGSPRSNKNKKYFCDICFRKFSAKHGLTQHKKRQHNIGGNLFACHICNKSFREKNELLMHKHIP